MMTMTTKTYTLDVDKVSFEEINNGDFIKLQMYIVSDGVNRNQSEFLRESFEEAIPTIYNKPILCYFSEEYYDAVEHNSEVRVDWESVDSYSSYLGNNERPVGVIPESAKITIEEVDGKNWIKIEDAIIWTEYNYELVKVLKKQLKKKISVEVMSVESEFDEQDIERIKKWKFLGVTILGTNKDGTPVAEGIEGAHLSLSGLSESKQFRKYSQTLIHEFSNKNDILSKYKVTDSRRSEVEMDREEFADKSKWGTGKAWTIDKSKEAVSHDTWSKVDKRGLRKAVLEGKNYKTAIKSVYLQIEEGWESAPSSKLKYPVMQIKGDKLVYNANGLLSAQQYAEKYDEEVAKKALSIRKKLGLVESKKGESMKKFIESAKESGYVFLGKFGNKLRFAEEATCEEDEKLEEKAVMSIFEIEAEKAEECDEFSSEGMEELDMKKVWKDDEDEDEDEDKDDKEDKDEDEKDEMAKKIEALESEKKEVERKLEEAEKEIKQAKDEKFKEETEKCMAEDKEVCEEDKEELRSMRDKGDFKDLKEFTKELAYRKYVRTMKARSGKFSFKLNGSVKDETEVDPLDTI